MAPLPGVHAAARDRDRFVLAHRPPRPGHDPWQHQGAFVEDERAADGTIVQVATILLTGRECPWRCVMCDLWTHTIEQDTPLGALPRQLDDALGALRRGSARPGHVKLYNAGSFFDPRAVPVADHDGIAERVATFDRVIVESHPVLIGPRVTGFREALARAAGDAAPPHLEVAIGLETAHPGALRQLHKGFVLDQFRRAAEDLAGRGASLRVFLLVGTPFIPPAEQHAWLLQSVAVAFDCGASAVSLIPTRPGNGAMEVLAAHGAFVRPSLGDVETALEASMRQARGRVFADLWDIASLATCPACFGARRERLHAMNLAQRPLPAVACAECGAEGRTP